MRGRMVGLAYLGMVYWAVAGITVAGIVLFVVMAVTDR